MLIFFFDNIRIPLFIKLMYESRIIYNLFIFAIFNLNIHIFSVDITYLLYIISYFIFILYYFDYFIILFILLILNILFIYLYLHKIVSNCFKTNINQMLLVQTSVSIIGGTIGSLYYLHIMLFVTSAQWWLISSIGILYYSTNYPNCINCVFVLWMVVKD